ncbi:unnamed protein product [Linum tenue]|uniref:Remorin C-terminal domain-containing protein n=1 Tax=Linum tenue TaxID=586396 RepID=A0AAV0RCG9_9ROSI|nr:unnamed protein product [Linum tenue]
MERLAKQGRRVTFSGPPQHQQDYTSPWTPQSFDGDNMVERSWFQRQDADYDEYDLKEMEYSAAVAAAAFAISSSLEEEEAGAADYRRKMEEDERRRSMGRPKSIIKEETPISRLASFRNLSIKEDRDPGESSDRRARQQQQQERGFPARRPSLSSGGEDSWEKAQLRKISKRYEKMEAKIVGWQEAKKMQTKLKMERKRNELEMRRTRNMQHYQGKMERIDMIANGAKGQLEEKRRKEEAEVKHKARLNLHSKGRSKNSCFGWN